MSSLEAVGTSSLHSSLKVPPMPFPAEQFLQPLLPCPSSLQSFTALRAGGVAGTSTRGTNIQPLQQQREREATETLAQRTGSGEAGPHKAFPSPVSCDGHKSLLPPQFGEHTLRSQQTHPQRRNFIFLFRRKEIADKTT